MSQPRALADCYFFLQGTCTKGDACRYRHCAAARATQTVCHYWAAGACVNPDCRFRHPPLPYAPNFGVLPPAAAATPPQQQQTAAQQQPQPQQQQQQQQRKECVFWRSGTCKNGASCPFLHTGAAAAGGPSAAATKKPEAKIAAPTPANTPTPQHKRPAPPSTTTATAAAATKAPNFGVKSLKELVGEDAERKAQTAREQQQQQQRQAEDEPSAKRMRPAASTDGETAAAAVAAPAVEEDYEGYAENPLDVEVGDDDGAAELYQQAAELLVSTDGVDETGADDGGDEDDDDFTVLV